mgnify:CR=1 FL=1
MKRNGTIGIIAAMPSELAQLLEQAQDVRTEEYHGLAFRTGTLCKWPVVLLRCGVGKVNAARGAQMLIDRFSPAAIINTGIAGGLAPGLAVGDAVVAAELVQHDFDTTPFGDARGFIYGEDSSRPTVFRADAALVRVLTQAAGAVLGAARVHTGLIATGDQFISGAAKKAGLRAAFGASAAEMEGGAIAQCASLSGVPFAVLRAISDLADGTAPGSYETFEQHAADAAAKTLCTALRLLAEETDR